MMGTQRYYKVYQIVHLPAQIEKPAYKLVELVNTPFASHEEAAKWIENNGVLNGEYTVFEVLKWQ